MISIFIFISINVIYYTLSMVVDTTVGGRLYCW
jgi:hypothetical protein